jgi:hypothetical protein
MCVCQVRTQSHSTSKKLKRNKSFHIAHSYLIDRAQTGSVAQSVSYKMDIAVCVLGCKDAKPSKWPITFASTAEVKNGGTILPLSSPTHTFPRHGADVSTGILSSLLTHADELGCNEIMAVTRSSANNLLHHEIQNKRDDYYQPNRELRGFASVVGIRLTCRYFVSLGVFSNCGRSAP